MAWTQPKTDWKPEDAFLLDPDYLRIRGNIRELHRRTQRLYLPFALAEMADYSIYDIPCTEFFDRVEQNTDLLLDRIYRPAGFPRGREFAPNSAVWNDAELNRLESAHALLDRALFAQKQARIPMKFRMGGGMLGAYLC